METQSFDNLVRLAAEMRSAMNLHTLPAPNPEVLTQLTGQWQDVLALTLWKLSPHTPVLLLHTEGAEFDALKDDLVLTVQAHPEGLVLALMPKAMLPA